MKHILKSSVSILSLLVLLTSCEEPMPEPNEWRILEWTVDGERHKASCERQGLLGCSSTDTRFNLTNGSFKVSGGKKINGFTQYIYPYFETLN